MRQLTKKETKDQFKPLKRKQEIVLVLENIQYARNVASMFRTADAAGVRRIVITGISKFPPFGKELQQTSRHKERQVPWEYEQEPTKAINKLKREGFKLVAAEITDNSVDLSELSSKLAGIDKVAIVLGSEVYGVANKTLELCDLAVSVPMYGKGASLNVSATGAIVLYAF